MWFAQNPMASQYSGAFCKMNVPLNLVGKFKNQTYPNTSAVTFPPHPEITNKYASPSSTCSWELLQFYPPGPRAVRDPSSRPWVQGHHRGLPGILSHRDILVGTRDSRGEGQCSFSEANQELHLGDGMCACLMELWAPLSLKSSLLLVKFRTASNKWYLSAICRVQTNFNFVALFVTGGGLQKLSSSLWLSHSPASKICPQHRFGLYMLLQS